MPTPNGQAAGASLSREVEEVRRLLAKGNAKKAVDAAKSLHKRVSTPATEALLVEAYMARARGMREQRLEAEANALMAMVRERYPASAASVEAYQKSLTFTERVRPLG